MKRILTTFFVVSLLALETFGQDLTIQSLTIQTTNVGPGSTTYANATISNIGEALANNSYIGYYLSTDSILTFSDRYVNAAYENSLYPGESDSVFASISIPSDLAVGNYFLFAFADYTGLVFETNEKNNSKFTRLTVAPLTIDLSVASFTPNNSKLAVGDAFSGSLVLFNGGNTPSNYTYTGYYFSTDSILDAGDGLLGTGYVYSISPSSYAYDYPSFYLPTTDTGNYYIIAYVDYGNNNLESNENNNTSFCKISIVPSITDLSIPSFTDSNSTTTAGTYYYPRTLIFNGGNTLVGNVSVAYYLSTDSLYGIGDTFLSSSYLGYLYGNTSTFDSPSLFIPSDLPVGNYYILAVADYNNLILETNEDNNTQSLAIKVIPPFVDVSIYGLSLYPNNVSYNSYIYPTLYEFNNGTSFASANTVGYFLSTDSSYDVGDTYLSSDYVYQVGPGGYASLYPSLYLPGTVPVGNYYLIAVADYGAAIIESNEKNNVQAVPFTISAPFVDLSISFLGPDTLSGALHASAGAYLYPRLLEFNNGNSLAGFSSTGYYLSSDSSFDIGDTFLGNDYVYGINGGSNTYLTPSLPIPSGVPTGHYYLVAVADYTYNVNESMEGNNIAFANLIVDSSSVDLSISFISSDSVIVYPGTYISPVLYEYNTGTSDAQRHNVGYFLSTNSILDSGDVFLSSSDVYGLTAGSSYYLNPLLGIPTDVNPGSYFILAIADNNQVIVETNESNNTSVLKTTVQSSNVDFSIYGLTVYSPVVTAGSAISTSLYEFNNGYSYGSSNYVGYYLSSDTIFDGADISLGTDYVPGIYATSYYYLSPYLSIPYYVSNGNYYVLAIADAYGQVNESNESNNVSFARITVGSYGVDLTISAVTAPTTQGYAGSFFEFANTETNQGNVDAAGHYVGYFLSTDSTYDVWDTYISTNYLAGLAAGRNQVFNMNWFVPSSTPDGIYYIVAVADYGTNVSETNEYNNTKALRITIGNVVIPPVGADLSLITLYANVSSIGAGQSLLVNYYDYNSGVLTAGPHNVDFYLSLDTTASWDDTVLGIQYQDSTSPGGSYLQTTHLLIPYATFSGPYYLVAVTDVGNNVVETDEYNNSRSFPIKVSGIITGDLSSILGMSEIKLYPNPSNGMVNFTTLENVEEIEVSDLNGHPVFNKSVNLSTEKTLDLGSLSAGIYVVKTRKEGATTSTNKIVISK